MCLRRAGSLIVALSLVTASIGCAPDQTGSDGDEIDCTDNEYYDQVHDRCVPRQTEDPEDTGTVLPDISREDTGTDSGTTFEDTGSTSADTTDTSGSEDTGRSESCDKDRDRSLSKACGGNDCDDNDATRSPKFPERCDQIDNDCDGQVNEGLDCTFYAHESDKLFKINPFEKTAKNVGANLPGLHDLDTHPDGTLYGVTPGGFYKFDGANGEWTQLKKFQQGSSWAPSNPNGMAINRSGTIFITSQDTLYKITKQKENGSSQWWVEQVGTMGTTDSGSKYVSSGDAVIYKRTLWMTSKHAKDQDHLVRLDPSSAKASNPLPIGKKNVFGLTTAWGELYGVTQSGELISINPQTGASTTVHKFDHRWYGAASTPRRDGRRK